MLSMNNFLRSNFKINIKSEPFVTAGIVCACIMLLSFFPKKNIFEQIVLLLSFLLFTPLFYVKLVLKKKICVKIALNLDICKSIVIFLEREERPNKLFSEKVQLIHGIRNAVHYPAGNLARSARPVSSGAYLFRRRCLAGLGFAGGVDLSGNSAPESGMGW